MAFLAKNLNCNNNGTFLHYSEIKSWKFSFSETQEEHEEHMKDLLNQMQTQIADDSYSFKVN